MSHLNPLTAISPLDGRYRNTCAHFADYFSEYALIKYRLWVEVEYFIALVELPLPQLKSFPKEDIPSLRNIVAYFNITEAEKIKATEKITNHDVKAVEYYIKEKLMPAAVGGDATHLAFASFYRFEYLLTWNCVHLANGNKRRHLEVINGRLKLPVPQILTPLELFHETI